MKKKNIFYLLVVLVISIGIITFLTKPRDNVNSSSKDIPNSLRKAVENALVDSRGTYGIVVKNLKTKEEYFSQENKIFEPGSLYKIWIMAAVFDQIEKGELLEDEMLSQDVAVLNGEFGISPDAAELTEGMVTLSVKDALEQMIVISHNYAALLLSERIKFSQIRLFLEEHGLNQSNLGEPPETTSLDTALFFEKLYKGELGSRENTDKMLALLKRQQLNDGLPKYLPQNIEVAHKTGDIGWFKHDAGIIYTDTGNDYIIVVMSESRSPAGAQERIALISKAVYDYFNAN